MRSVHSTAKPSKPKQSRRDYVLLAAISLAVGLVIFICASVVWYLWQRNHYLTFVSTLSDSTVYAYENGTLTGREDGAAFSLDRETGYQLYTLLSNQQGKPRRQVPRESPLLTLDYGDGAVLELWPVELDGDTQRQTGILWRFTSSDGHAWVYDTDRFGPNTVEKLGQP